MGAGTPDGRLEALQAHTCPRITTEVGSMTEASGDGEAGREQPLSHAGGQAGQGGDTLSHARRRQGSGKAVPAHCNEGVAFLKSLEHSKEACNPSLPAKPDVTLFLHEGPAQSA